MSARNVNARLYKSKWADDIRKWIYMLERIVISILINKIVTFCQLILNKKAIIKKSFSRIEQNR